jgi:hypothetical protein
MEKIVVIDHFLLKDELEIVKKKVDHMKWGYYHTSNGTPEEIPFWTCYLNEDPYFTEYIKHLIEKQLSRKFKIERVYCNGQTFGQDGAYHIDSEHEDNYTFCLYVNHIKPYDIDLACGYLYFKLPGLNHKICYEPIDNRAIFFPSNYIHKSSSFSRFIKDLRICIAYKLTEIKT